MSKLSIHKPSYFNEDNTPVTDSKRGLSLLWVKEDRKKHVCRKISKHLLWDDEKVCS